MSIHHPDFGHTSQWRHDTPISGTPCLYLDLETTGLHPDQGHRMTDVAVLDRGGARVVWHLPDDNPGLSVEQIRRLDECLGEGVVIGHNLSFDLGFIAAEADRLDESGIDCIYIDTLGIARDCMDMEAFDDRRLATVAEALDLEVPDDLHEAVPDARLVGDVFDAMIERFDLETLGDAGVQKLRL